jgi:hypothetical protein
MFEAPDPLGQFTFASVEVSIEAGEFYTVRKYSFLQSLIEALHVVQESLGRDDG